MMAADAHGTHGVQSRMRVLIVDDSSLLRTILTELLAPLGCEVVEVGSGEEALRTLALHDFDLVLLDMVMPGMDGLVVLKDMRSRPGPWIPVIVMTSLEDPEARIRAITSGADNYLRKPFEEPVLLARVRSLLAMRAIQSKLERLREQQRELTEFLVHDIRTPLTAASLNLGVVLREPLEPAAKEPLIEAQHAIRKANSMLNDMLEIGRLDAAGFTLPMAQIEGVSLSRRAAASFREETRLRSIELVVDASGEPLIRGNVDLLTRALENLVGNALRYVFDGGRIRVAVQSDREFVNFTVANNGPPVPVERRRAIFEKYVTSAREGARGRFGIGLYFCRRVAEMHGGSISVTETPEWPAVFCLRLPAVHPAGGAPLGGGE